MEEDVVEKREMKKSWSTGSRSGTREQVGNDDPMLCRLRR